jgi:glucose-6-phosphate 1-dehydrogenase
MADSATLVIFGATGNLSHVKLIPSLYHLEVAGMLDDELKILCSGRSRLSHEDWLKKVADSVGQYSRDGWNEAIFERFAKRIHYIAGDYAEIETFENLKSTLNEGFPPNHAYYLSLPPSHYVPVVQSLAKLEMLEESSHWRRVVIEKPFGRDQESATSLQNMLSKHLQEQQTYRIDHYMGKAMVQNILVSRFANLMLNPCGTAITLTMYK